MRKKQTTDRKLNIYFIIRLLCKDMLNKQKINKNKNTSLHVILFLPFDKGLFYFCFSQRTFLSDLVSLFQCFSFGFWHQLWLFLFPAPLTLFDVYVCDACFLVLPFRFNSNIFNFPNISLIIPLII